MGMMIPPAGGEGRHSMVDARMGSGPWMAYVVVEGVFVIVIGMAAETGFEGDGAEVGWEGAA
jgi:hypothetical protein